MSIVVMLALVSAKAQTNLSGRVYHNANIMKGEFQDIDKRLVESKAKAIAEAEKKKGRKLTAAEMKEIDEKEKDAAAKVKAVVEGTKIAITARFKSATEAVMKVDISISDDAMKMAGVSWAKRQALKAALAIAPTSQDLHYTVKKDLVIFYMDEDRDTLRLSNDGKQLYGIYEGSGKKKKATKYVLTRTK